MQITSDRAGETESGKHVPAGTTVKYLGHVPGGVWVLFADGSREFMSALCFPELR